ncbi:MAG: patatin family protein [Atopobiaceae bacterium]|jgi:predicted patatin/cPLA2 family phospholipase
MNDDNIALVLEGGGLRGQFTAGVLDVLQERGLGDAFSCVLGTSAGAINGANFRSRQIGRMMRDTLAYRDDKRFMSLYALAKTGSIAGNDFLYHEVQEVLDPFDWDAYNARRLPLWAVATDIVFGVPAYLEIGRLPDDMDKIRASASLPVVSEVVQVDGHLYLDGGTMDAVPVEAALGLEGAPRIEGHEPASRAFVVLTREHGYAKEGPYELMALAEARYREYPFYLEALRTRPERYNPQRETIRELEREGRAFVVEPPEPIDIAATERSGDKLLGAYVLGRQEMTRRLDEARGFLGSRDAS